MKSNLLDTQAIYLQIYESFKCDILEGAYTYGQRLPSIRKLASDLDVARNTVESAYRQLMQEGFVSSRPGSGYWVEQLSTHEGAVSTSAHESVSAFGSHERQLIAGTHKPPAPCLYDFSFDNLEEDAFPFDTWRRLTADALYSVEAQGACCYHDNQGDYLLRLNIANHLRKSRGVRCFPEQVVIQAGTQAALLNLMQLFDPSKDTVAMEEPGFEGARIVFEQCGFDVIPCPVHQGFSAYLRFLSTSDTKLCFSTPSNQFPTGAVMPKHARLQLLEWAQAHDAYILEDDCCREFSYKPRPVPSLQSLDTNHRVIYLGTFSKSLSPALRVSYLVLPPELLDRWKQHFRLYHSAVPWLSQVVLRRFIAEGHWEKLLRRAHTRNKRKYEALVAAIGAFMKGKVELWESGTGLHVLVRVRDGRSEQQLVGLAREAGVGVYETSRYWMGADPLRGQHILIGFSSIREEDIAPGIQALAQAWFG
ncbi:MAG: PLP-dependent aminotransferase family protein [Eggerthellaceae bacterium]|nr:PLP-dependent aminotransferase family protein [Eggerthellaceae bacterium]